MIYIDYIIPQSPFLGSLKAKIIVTQLPSNSPKVGYRSQMTMKTKNEVFKEHLKGWLKSKNDRKKRAEIAAHLVFATKCHPKSVSRTFKRLQLRDPVLAEKRGRPSYYDHDVVSALRDLWEVSDRSCGENIHPMILAYTAVLVRDSLWTHGDVATIKNQGKPMGYINVYELEQS